MSECRQEIVSIRRRRRLLAVCSVCVLVMILGCGGWLLWSSQHGWTVRKVEQLIEVEVPPDCDKATAESWFNRHGIRCEWLEDTTGDMRGHQTMPQLAGFQSQYLSGMLRGEILSREANVDLIFPGEISIYFFFDKQGRCVGHLVDPFVCMP